MGIGDYTKQLRSAGSGANDLFIAAPDTPEKIHVETPAKAPAFGKQIMAWLSNLPRLDSWESLQQARIEVDQYIQLNKNQRLNSRACLTGFVAALKGAYGPEIADMCMKTAGIKEGQRLTARQVRVAIEVGTEKRAANQKVNAETVDRFFDRATPSGKSGMDQCVADVVKAGAPDGAGGNVGVDARAATIIEACVRQRCADLPAYSHGRIGVKQVADIAREVLTCYQNILTSKDKAIADDPLRALKFELSQKSGDVDPEFQAAMAGYLANPVVSDELMTLSGGDTVGKEFYQAVMSGAFSLRVERGGQAPIEIGGGDAWAKLTQGERLFKFAEGYRQLDTFCKNADVDATQLTQTFPQCLRDSFLEASAQVDSASQTPLRLLDGRMVRPEGATQEAFQMTIRHEDFGSALSLTVDYSAKGFRSAEYVGRTLQLDPQSMLHYSFEAKLGGTSGLVLAGPVSCEAALVENDRPEPIPTDLERVDKPAYESMAIYAAIQKPAMMPDIRQLGLLNAFHEAPSLDALNRFLEQLGDDDPNVSKEERAAFHEAFKAHFDPLVGALETLVDELSKPEAPDNGAALLYFRTLVGGLRGSQSMADAQALYRDAVLGEKAVIKLVLTDEQRQSVVQAYAKAAAPLEGDVIELMKGVRKKLVDRLSRDFLPDFVAAMKG